MGRGHRKKPGRSHDVADRSHPRSHTAERDPHLKTTSRAGHCRVPGPSIAAHNRQEQQGVFSGRNTAPGPHGPHRRIHANGSHSGARLKRFQQASFSAGVSWGWPTITACTSGSAHRRAPHPQTSGDGGRHETLGSGGDHVETLPPTSARETQELQGGQQQHQGQTATNPSHRPVAATKPRTHRTGQQHHQQHPAQLGRQGRQQGP